ncbi:MAG TPA: hypothetical protein VFN09_12160 [Rhodanobacteraceae bacterium]|nr:hypothetical protein [Rhodanobacteraceae bacterium]
MPRIALVTARVARGTDHDMPALLQAFSVAGAHAEEADWDDPAVDWSRYDAALLRSPWDYVDRHAEFMVWAERTAGLTRLLNPLHVLRWNIDKHYLADLAAAGVATVPSRFIEPAEDADAALSAFLAEHPASTEFVIKPAIGAGSRDARRHGRDQLDAMREHLHQLLAVGRSALLQPYLARVDLAGETALIYLDGEFNHAIRKGPLLRPGAAATRELYASEDIAPRTAEPDELALAARAVASIPVEASLCYARVDLIRDDAGAPCLLELELVEPSLFFAHATGSASRLAAAVLQHTPRSAL